MRRNQISSKPVLAALLLAAAPYLHAQEALSGFSYGIDTELQYDSNIYRAESREKSSLILEASPFVKATFMNRGNSYQLGYRLNYAEYFSASSDSYDDHEFTLDINHRFTPRQAITAKAAHRLLTEQRGTGFSEEPNELVRGPDDYKATELEATYFIGSAEARARLELSAAHDILRFNSSYVDDTRDYQSTQVGALLRYRLGGRTDLLAEYRRYAVRFDNTPLDAAGQPINLDSDEDFFLAGIGWELTANTRGEVRVGHSDRDYKDGDFSESGLHWEAEITWRPRSYSEFVLNTGRESLETYGSGRYINVRSHSLAWNHAWRGRISSKLEVGLSKDDYEDSIRKDDRLFWQGVLFYEPRTWLNLSGGVRYWENDSSFSPVDYKRHMIFVRAAVEL